MRDSRVDTTEADLVRDHLPLVHYVVNEMAARLPRHVSRDDLVSAGMAGLAQAARSFDPDRGIRFDRYASTRIRGSLLDELRSCDWASRTVRAKARRLNEATDSLTGQLGRNPTAAEVAEKAGCSEGEVRTNGADVHRSVVLNFETLMEGAACPEDLLPCPDATPDEVLIDRERKAQLIDAVAVLPDRLRHVVVSYFFEEKPMHVIGRELGVSESRISQLRAEALGLLRSGLTADPDLDAA